MHVEGIKHILGALKSCGASNDLQTGQRIHAEVMETEEGSNVFVANALVDMYVKCNRMDHAYRLFENMQQRTVTSWNHIIMGYAMNGESQTALELYSQIHRKCEPNTLTFVAALRACTILAEKEQAEVVNGKLIKVGCLKRGKCIHLEATANGRHLSTSLLVNFYAKCGSMVDAQRIFERCKNHSVVCWSIMILGYAQNGEGQLSLQLFKQMQEQGCVPNHVTVLAALKACGSLAEKEEAQIIDGQVVKVECLRNCVFIHGNCRDDVPINVASSLVDVYSKCGSMDNARQVFDSILGPDLVAWNCIITGYAASGKALLALKMFSRMQEQGFAPDAITYVAALRALGSLAEQETGIMINGKTLKPWGLNGCRKIHLQVLKTERKLDLFLASMLVETYAKCGSMVDARAVFEKTNFKDAALWGPIILGYCLSGEFRVALELFSRMQSEGCTPNVMGVSAALKACSGMSIEDGVDKVELLEQGRKIHQVAGNNGQASNILVANVLVDMYAKCGDLEEAQRIFEGIQPQTTVSWNCIIMGYVHNGENLQALEFYQVMQNHGCIPNAATFVSALKACANLGEMEEIPEKRQKWLERGRDIHSQARNGMDIFVESILVDMYSKCGSLVDARRVFDNMQHRNAVSWTAIIQGYARSGKGELALELYQQMQDDGCTPDLVTIVAALKTCASLAEGAPAVLEKARIIHRQAMNLNFGDIKKLGCVLVDMYVKFGSMVDARQVFEGMDPSNRDVVTWTSLLQGYAQVGEYEMVLDLYERMQVDTTPDFLTYVTVLKACGNMAALESGRKVHLQICEAGMDGLDMVANSLLDFYGKCGCMAEAETVFNGMIDRDLVSWGTLIAGFSRQGNTARVFELFHRMQDEDKLQPNEVIYLSVLAACSHAGMVKEGKTYFELMCSSERLKPGVEHYNCMVYMLARADRFEEAVQVAKGMPVSADEVTWTSLLSACFKWKNVELGRVAYKEVVELDGSNAAAFVLMSNIHRVDTES